MLPPREDTGTNVLRLGVYVASVLQSPPWRGDFPTTIVGEIAEDGLVGL